MKKIHLSSHFTHKQKIAEWVLPLIYDIIAQNESFLQVGNKKPQWTKYANFP